MKTRLGIFLLALAILPAQAQQATSGPVVKVYKTVGDRKLTAHVFQAEETKPGELRPVIVLLHGGGWVAGSPEWVYDAAKRYASYGAVAVGVEYRLADQKSITPLDAQEDARDAVRWVRRNAAELGIDPKRVAVYGVSAGGQLAGWLATLGDADKSEISAAPNAMVLISPAVSVEHDGWFQRILGKNATAESVSPSEHIDKKLPPTIIFHGVADTLVPIAGVRRYCDRAKKFGGECRVYSYEGVGHLFTRKLDSQEDDFDPDPKVVTDARKKGDEFLAKRGFLPLYTKRADSKGK